MAERSQVDGERSGPVEVRSSPAAQPVLKINEVE
jgi:hypothetical protein